MTIEKWLILALWAAFVLYWGIAARGAKRNLGSQSWGQEATLRAGVLVFVILVLAIPGVHQALLGAPLAAAWRGAAGAAGVALVALGIGLAVWARRHLGRNWGMPMSRKEDPELVTTGPYARLRHPIYSGVILAMFGSVLGASVFWLVPLVVYGAYFIYSARREEKLMLAQFPAQYGAYRRRTNMLVPFLL